MRVLVLGAGGMLGHKLVQRLAGEHEVSGTVRSAHHPAAGLLLRDLCDPLIGGVDATDMDSVVAAFGEVRPDVVLNCIGVIKQVPAASDPRVSLRVNALFPHELAELCRASGCRLVHFSTDCVFSGRRGGYRETDDPAPVDLYGRSKLLGEVDGEGRLTLRTSIVGHDLAKEVGLLDWFLGQRGQTVRGFRKAVFSGFPTVTFARIVGRLIVDHPELHDVYHVAGPPIDKHELLVRIRDAMDLDIEIVPDEEVEVDRSLDGSRFWEATGYRPPTWDGMIRELVEDIAAYEEHARSDTTR